MFITVTRPGVDRPLRLAAAAIAYMDEITDGAALHLVGGQSLRVEQSPAEIELLCGSALGLQAEEKQDVCLLDSNAFGRMIEIGQGHVPLTEVAQAAYTASGLTPQAWNGLEQPWRDAAIATAIDGLRAQAVTPETASAATEAAATAAAPEGRVTTARVANRPAQAQPARKGRKRGR